MHIYGHLAPPAAHIGIYADLFTRPEYTIVYLALFGEQYIRV